MSSLPDIGVIDLMMGTRAPDSGQYQFLAQQLRDAGSRSMTFPAGYMFKDVPTSEGDLEGAALLLPHMDRHGVERALINVGPSNEAAQRALRDHPDRFLASFQVDPNAGMDGVRALVDAHERWGVRAATAFPAGYSPQVPINDRRMYPIYAKCVELGIAMIVNAGVPGPRVPMACQDVAHFDEVCYDFPELTIVMRHGGEPWEELAVKLMLKWPGLHYMTSGFAPRYYPRAIVDYANSRGADKVLYAGYFPMGLSLDRIFAELPDVPFAEHVWPKFLRHNAERVLGLD
ncbi:MAG: amidohydrolase family protein [Microthrixaceae bacterium]